LARALLRRPAILLLDEATSDLDNVTERIVADNLARLRCTRIVIAHRLSTVIDADRIVVLERGAVAETGSHAALLARNGIYAELVRAQNEGG
jgi:ABC-type multidrug transport system fused ATPase/permease subunit